MAGSKDWDRRWREIRDEHSASLDREQQEKRDREREVREREERERQRDLALPASLLDVSRWAIRKYESAGVPPLPIYVKWRKKPFFKSQDPLAGLAGEVLRRQVGTGFPISAHMTHHANTSTSDYASGDYYSGDVLVVTSEEKLISVYFGGNHYREEDGVKAALELTEIAFFDIHDLAGKDPRKNIGAIFRSLSPKASEWLGAFYGERGDEASLDRLCANIADFVARKSILAGNR